MKRTLTLESLLVAAVLVAGCARPASPPPPTATTAPATPTPGPLVLDTDATEFGSLVRLEAARLLTPAVQQGDEVTLELTWRLLRPTGRDLQVSAQVVDRAGQALARHDTTIGGPSSGTSGWEAGASGRDELHLRVPTTVDPGRYALAVIVTDPRSGARIPVSAEGGLPPVVVTDRFTLGAVVVAPTRD